MGFKRDPNITYYSKIKMKRTKSPSTSDGSPYQSDTKQTDHKKRKVSQPDSLIMQSLFVEIKENK
ncbi:15055_t:CDS:2 [Acaulospora morrowiae]|uniref:15055_t:CDS:1 n=1 Tax=Acaulospora morrowiae TaxID=94023 RepID=A0A9N8V6G5_9GLOM|nr:15055_t:CDS:2 [Acaulospora morrowiae]